MKNKGFGHLKTWLFTIKNISKNAGLGGPWYLLPYIYAIHVVGKYIVMAPWIRHGYELSTYTSLQEFDSLNFELDLNSNIPAIQPPRLHHQKRRWKYMEGWTEEHLSKP